MKKFKDSHSYAVKDNKKLKRRSSITATTKSKKGRKK